MGKWLEASHAVANLLKMVGFICLHALYYDDKSLAYFLYESPLKWNNFPLNERLD